MGVTVDVTRVACNTSTGNQTITFSNLGGLTPKAALFTLSFGVTDGTAASDNVLSFGAATGTSNRWVITHTDEDGQGSSDTTSGMDDTDVILTFTPGTTTDDCRADLVSFGADQLVINWSNAPPSGYLLTVKAFAGTDLSAHANTAATHGTVDNAVDITDPGFEPDVVIAASAGRSAGLPSGGNTAASNIGFIHNDRASGITQRMAAIHSRNNKATSEIGAVLEDGYGAASVLVGSLLTGYEFGSFDSGGFSITTRLDSFSVDVGYLALRFGSGPTVDSYVGTYSTPTSTGNDSETGPGFTPQSLMLLGTHTETIDTFETDSDAGCLSVSAITANAEYCTAVNSEDAQGTTDTQSMSDDTAINLPDDDGTAGLVASYVSMDATGYTLNYSAVKANAKLFAVLAIEESPAVGRTTKNTDAFPLGIHTGMAWRINQP